ncbi:hypothetical protein [Desulfonatronum thioautotrophicum]|uniref:hypothetical protein n=1 Tax=Desulfonatronum thioautotrophicum TaxID=617001 RepID=UPI00069C98B0|nr:hypothetical protein [Desulfonatronum thioautotrophicum]
MNIHNEKILSVLKECQKHLYRMDMASSEIAHLIPLSARSLDNLSDNDVKTLDQFLFRFSKLQDSIGKKLFKATLLALGEDIENDSFIDILNRLEKLNLLSDVNGWFELRRLRNELAHEYEEDKESLAEAINLIFESSHKLKSYYFAIHAEMQKRLSRTT